MAPSPSALGWSGEKLAVARRFSDQIGSDAVVIVDRGVVAAQWGEVARNHLVQSIRKNFLSALYGIYEEAGKIDLQATLADLGIDEKPPGLSAVEKQATVEHLLQARSGVYHKAVAEMPRMEALRPARGRHAPGTFWYYNNWDFNALGTIFEQYAGIDLYEALEQRLDGPLQMQDFSADLGRCYYQEELSVHPVHHFAMSARDLARFGLLYLRRGRWRGRQLIPERWIERSITPYSDVGDGRRDYGYTWWIGRPEAYGGHALYMARGGDGHALYIAPTLDVVLVHRIDRCTFEKGWTEVDQLMVMLLKAHPRG